MIIRRIRRSEQAVLANLCRSDSRWSRYYNNHDKWLQKALTDVGAEDRVAFGAFDLEQGDGDLYDSKLVACIFLKLSRFENSIEFKNLILPSNRIDLDENSQEITKKIIYKAVRFCEVRGILKIEIEIPQEEHGVISAFLSSGFKVVALRERFSQGNRVCILEHTTGGDYHGDPFDTIKFSKWLLNSYISCDVKNIEQYRGSEVVRISFEGKTSTKTFNQTNVGKIKKLNGDMIVIEDADLSDEDIISCVTSLIPKPNVTLVLAETLSEKVKSELCTLGTTYFDRNEFTEIAGGKNSSLSIPIALEDISGAITVLEYEQIIDYAAKKSITYYLLSGIHNGLSLPDEDNLILGIYCPDYKGKGAGIVGLCLINEIERPTLAELLNEELEKDSALSREDLSFYKTYSEDEKIASLKCTQISLLESPLSLKNGSWISEDKVRQYLISELVKNANNSTYLDEESCIKLHDHFRENSFQLSNELISVKPSKEIPNFEVALSYSSENRSFVEKIVFCLEGRLGENKVFYDMHYEAELNRKDLDLFLSDIYRNKCKIAVIFLSKDYSSKNWCRLEWRIMRSVFLSSKSNLNHMVFKFDDVKIDGLLDIDGYTMIDDKTPETICEMILKRLGSI